MAFSLGLTPANEALAMVSGIVFSMSLKGLDLVMVNSEFCSYVGLRENGQYAEIAATIYCKQ